MALAQKSCRRQHCGGCRATQRFQDDAGANPHRASRTLQHRKTARCRTSPTAASVIWAVWNICSRRCTAEKADWQPAARKTACDGVVPIRTHTQRAPRRGQRSGGKHSQNRTQAVHRSFANANLRRFLRERDKLAASAKTMWRNTTCRCRGPLTWKTIIRNTGTASPPRYNPIRRWRCASTADTAMPKAIWKLAAERIPQRRWTNMRLRWKRSARNRQPVFQTALFRYRKSASSRRRIFVTRKTKNGFWTRTLRRAARRGITLNWRIAASPPWT